MDNAQVEHELEDVEAKLERLRSLYEQYFLGMEKLEPTVLRKDVDRKFWVLRKEQIRNTGLRFKFQGLIQRYNTYQQYWTRVVREIENGTYRRDVIKVAKRFGEKEALTILGKRRAEQFKRLAANQADRRAKRKAAFGQEADDRAPDVAAAEEEAPMSLGAEDIEVVDDRDDDSERETPPRAMPPVAADPEPDMESLLMAATVGVKTWGPPKVTPIATPTPAAKPRRPSSAPPAARSKSTSTIPPASTRPKVASIPPASTRPKAPSIPPAAPKERPAKAAPIALAAGKSRVAELAAQMRAKKLEAARPKADDLELDRLFDPPAPRPPPEPSPATAAPTPTPQPQPKPAPQPQPKPAPAASPAAPSIPATRPAPTQPQARSIPASSVARPFSKPLVSTPPATATPSAQPKPAVSMPAAPAPVQPARKEDLSDQKMREIYAKYVGAKRAANESTAGLTYDKLAASLRAQADKIKTSHPTRSIDFEVVTKDGKTALRPIVK